jgi:serine/threonine-protein kinase
MGEVWQSTDTRLERQVAVKLLHEDCARDQQCLDLFRREAQAVSRVSHPGVVQVYDYGESELPVPYLAMELVDGPTLAGELEVGGPAGAGRTLRILSQVAQALQAVHDAGVVHRDIKPANLLLSGSLTVKIADFGIAQAADQSPLVEPGQITGTATYLSPEQARGERTTPASDLYSLGVVAYACLTGKPPFVRETQTGTVKAQVEETPPALPLTVPSALRCLVATLLRKDPRHRPASAAVVARIAHRLEAVDRAAGKHRSASTRCPQPSARRSRHRTAICACRPDPTVAA